MEEVKEGKQNLHGSHSTASHSPSPSDGCSYYYCVTVFIYCYPCKCCNERCLFILGTLKNGSLFSFGYGPYSCIGKNFAVQEMKVVVVRLLQNFRFSIDTGNDEFIQQVAFTLKTYAQENFSVFQT